MGPINYVSGILKINWSVLYRIVSCVEMVNCIYSVLHNLLDYYLPVISVSTYSADRPWVTDHFLLVLAKILQS